MTDWGEERPTPELVKTMISVPEVAEMYGFEPQGGKITSILAPEERTPSLHLFDDHWFDFGRGKGGDVIDFVQIVEGCTYSQALWRLWTKSLKAGREPGDVERQPVRQVMDFTEQLEDEGWPVDPRFDYLRPPSNCRSVRPFNGPALLIPHADAEGVYGVKVRHADGRKDAWPGSQFTKRLYDPDGWSHSIDRPNALAVIAEGESDCWALRELVWPAYVFALPAGAATWKDSWLEDLEPFDKVWICTDNDRAGQQARDKLTSKIGYLKAEQLFVPPLYGDAREAIAAGWRPQITRM